MKVLTDARHDTTAIDGAPIHSVTVGSGPSLVFVAGWPEWWWAWRHVMAALADRYTVHAVDLRGQGASHKPLTGYDTGTVAKELNHWARLRGVEDFVLVGHDVGAWVSYSYAASYPQGLRGLVLMEALIPGLAAGEVKPGRPDDAANIMQYQFSFCRLPALPEILVGGHEREFIAWMFEHKSKHPDLLSDDVIEAYAEALEDKGFLRAGFDYYRALPQSDEQNKELAKTRLPMPVLAIGAGAGVGHALYKQLLPIADDVEDGTIEDCGHYQMEEKPQAVVTTLEPFLKRCFTSQVVNV